MSLGLALVAVLIVALAAGWVGYARGRRLRAVGRLHSLPVYHGAYAALWAAIPALLTTLGILLSLLFASLRFFKLYPLGSFLFGTEGARKRRSAPTRRARRVRSGRFPCFGAHSSSAASSR